MEKLILTLSFITVVVLNTQAQDTTSQTFASWVIESQGEHAKTQTVNFYDSKAQLIYTESINARLNVSKKKVQKMLNEILNQLVSQKAYRENKNILVASFKLKQK